jgi:hypothetical protein
MQNLWSDCQRKIEELAKETETKVDLIHHKARASSAGNRSITA